MPLKQKIKWEEFEFTIYEQAGHTLFSAAIEFTVDGKRVLAIGDQYQEDDGQFNYVYHNKFRIWDYIDSAKLYKTVNPDILISGHWEPVIVTEEFLRRIEEKGKELEQLHRDLLPLNELDLGAEGFGASFHPYQTEVEPGKTFSVTVEIKNPFHEEKEVFAKMITPMDWSVDKGEFKAKFTSMETTQFTTYITVPLGTTGYRERIAVDLTVGEHHFGQHAEALVTILGGDK
ncbi:hypothetical protein [Neobacillus sp. B4I6]|uniref:hypothetical protein n=1 Tax=Neobacillus sp. B4I6 TaxID=3373925 RepID=UPI003D1E5D05